RLLEMLKPDAARAQVAAVDVAGQIAFSAQELAAPLDRLLERQALQAVQRIVMHEGPHGPVLSDDFAREADRPAKLHPLGVGIGGGRHRFHVVDSVACICGAGAPESRSRGGTRPSATSRTMTSTKDAVSDGYRS